MVTMGTFSTDIDVKAVPSRTSKDVAIFESLDTDLDVLVTDEQREVRRYPDFARGHDETWSSFLYRMGTEGHTYYDAWLLAAGAIGQVMMTTPNAWYQMGLIPGAIMIVWGTIIGVWTINQTVALYFDRKRDLIKAAEWFDDPDKPHARKKKTQSQEMLGHYLGPWGVRLITIMVFFSWFGSGVVQILASATNYYSIDQSMSLRAYTFIFGATLIPFGLLSNFRKVRLILIIGVFGTTFAAAYGIFVASQKGFAEASSANLWPATRKNTVVVFQPFFNGAAILFSILDHHTIVSETLEAMQHPKKYFKTYLWGFFPLIFMIVPPGILLNLAFAKSGIATAGNWFQLCPSSVGKTLAVWLMILHNVQAWTLWMTAFGFTWEKLVGTHEKALWIRVTSRLPFLIAIYIFAAAFPFYGAVNSFLSGLFSPLLTYTLPCFVFWRHYRHKENRDRMTYDNSRKVIDFLGWRTVAAINIALVTYGIILVGFTSTMGIINLVQLRQSASGVFPECWNCAAYRT